MSTGHGGCGVESQPGQNVTIKMTWFKLKNNSKTTLELLKKWISNAISMKKKRPKILKIVKLVCIEWSRIWRDNPTDENKIFSSCVNYFQQSLM